LRKEGGSGDAVAMMAVIFKEQEMRNQI